MGPEQGQRPEDVDLVLDELRAEEIRETRARLWAPMGPFLRDREAIARATTFDFALDPWSAGGWTGRVEASDRYPEEADRQEMLDPAIAHAEPRRPGRRCGSRGARTTP